LNGLAVNLSVTDFRLVLRYGEQGTVVNGFNKTITESIESRPQRADVFCSGDVFLRLWNYCSVVDDGSARDSICAIVNQHGGIHEIAVCVLVTCAEFSELAGATTDGVLVALGARSAVEYRA
jgi:hypothetical protein